MIQRIANHARARLDFPGEVTRAQRVDACKRFIRLETELIHRRHRAGESGLAVAHALATVMDLALARVFDYAVASYQRAEGQLPAQVALVALGGYGRSELCPRSDVDLMFLYPSKVRDPRLEALQKTLTDEVLYVLWDTGLKVGHSTRTLDQVFDEARRDMQSKTALLDARRLAGSATLYETFATSYRSYTLNENPRSYIEQRLVDQENRREKYGNTVFLQEPDIKSGVGGLRDYQSSLWMAKVKLGVLTVEELVSLKYLSEKELRAFTAGYDFLLRVRHDLHFNTRHSSDLLTLEAQPAVAERLGYDERDALRRVEMFMRDYYRHAHAIHSTTRILENRLALRPAPGEQTRFSFRDVLFARRHQRLKRLDGFVLRGQELSAEKTDVFEEDPRRLVRVFRHCQLLNAKPDFDLATLIRESLHLLTRRVVQSQETNISFRTILESPGQVHPTLALMHELGVLGRFIPEFGRITCLVQHELYHRYTADIHTLNTIEQLDRVFQGTEEITLKYAAELRETTWPPLLYIVLLLHDIGKAVSIANHGEIGTRLALPILERLELDPKSIELSLFLIRNHLMMARFWQKHDVDDPQAAAAFGALVGDVEKLRLLYVHTFCDARGTAGTLWNSYKDTLHASLFRATRDRLTLGNAVELRNQERKEMMRREFVDAALAGIAPEEIEAHFSLLPERYFVHTSREEIELHIRMVNQLVRSIADATSVGSLLPVIDWSDDVHRSVTNVNIVTWDRAGLFYRLAGAFSVAGLNILSAKINTRHDHIAIDAFDVVEPNRGLVQSKQVMETFRKTVEQALVHNRDLMPDIVAQARKHRSSFLGNERTLQHDFTPHVDVYHELSLKRTIIEVQAPDQIGLLYRVSRTIFDHGFDISFARINTERGIAIDTFYIESANKAQDVGTTELLLLRDAISEVVTPPEAARAQA